jgi:hypothetical protein
MMKCVILILGSILMPTAAPAQNAAKARWQNGSRIVESTRPFPLARFIAPGIPYTYAEESSHCAQAGKNLRICKSISATGIVFVFEVNGTRIGEWPTSSYAGSRFEILKGDLDGDRIDEIIVANLVGISCGMGIHNWKISIFPNPHILGFQPPLEFSVEDFGARGSFVRHAGDRRCQILVTEWQYLDHPERGNGMYIIGRWYNYRKGALMPVKHRPAVVRRLLYGFAEHAASTKEDPRIPLSWFNNSQTETISIDPATLGKQSSNATGIIKRIIPSGDEDAYSGLKIEVVLDSGQSRVYIHSARSFEDSDEYFFRFGAADSGKIYPDNYNPASLNNWLIGRKVKISAYELSTLGSRLGTRQIIWLQNR